jgi:hypothetical protein
MPELKTQNFDPEDFRNLDIEEIISAPLTAVSTANGMMAREQVGFIMDFCFNREGENYKPVMIKMAITKGVIQSGGDDEEDYHQITTTFNLPLLTIIPISSLAIESVSVDFEIELTSQTKINKGLENKESGKLAIAPPKPRLLGKISHDSGQRSEDSDKHEHRSTNSSGLKVSLKAGKVPLSMGLTTILDLYTKAIGPAEKQDGSDNKKG